MNAMAETVATCVGAWSRHEENIYKEENAMTSDYCKYCKYCEERRRTDYFDPKDFSMFTTEKKYYCSKHRLPIRKIDQCKDKQKKMY